MFFCRDFVTLQTNLYSVICYANLGSHCSVLVVYHLWSSGYNISPRVFGSHGVPAPRHRPKLWLMSQCFDAERPK